jgi:hypothetical protein
LLCWAVDDVRLYRRDAQGNKTDRQRLWQMLTMREGKIVRIQDYTDQATASKRPGCPPARKGPADNLAEVSMPDLRGLVLAGNVAARGPLSAYSIDASAGDV